MLIYKITNNVNSKIYIGQTIGKIEARWKRHTWECTKKRNAMAITSAIIKYGEENFIIEKIDDAKTINELNEKEVYYIMLYNTISPNGYNLDIGGKNFKRTEETCKKMSMSKKNREVSEETRKKLSISHLGHIMSPETRKKLSDINKLKTIDKKVREAASLKNSKSYILIKDNELYVIKNMKKFAKINNYQNSNLCQLVRGKISQYKNFKYILNLEHIEIDEIISISEKYKAEYDCININYFL